MICTVCGKENENIPSNAESYHSFGRMYCLNTHIVEYCKTEGCQGCFAYKRNEYVCPICCNLNPNCKFPQHSSDIIKETKTINIPIIGWMFK